MTKKSPFQPPQRKPESQKKSETQEFSLDINNENNLNTDNTDSTENNDNINHNENNLSTEHTDYNDYNDFALENSYPVANPTIDNEDVDNDSTVYDGYNIDDEHVEDNESDVDEQSYDDNNKGKGKKIALIVAGVVVAAAVAISGGVYYINSQDTLIPVAKAQEYISYEDTDDLCAEFASFNCNPVWEFSDLNNGQLISQSVSPGDELEEGGEITLTYSKGPERAIVPNVIGLTEEDGRQKLYNLGFKVNNINKVDAPGQQANTIVEISGAIIGEESVNGSIVNFSVANGKITVPDWTGKTKEYVQSESDNMNIDVILTEEESNEPVGTVISQSVNGEEVNEGDAVEVVIAKGFEDVQVVIPDVLTMSIEEAQSNLAANGFRKIVTVVVKNNEVTTPQVTNVIPSIGSEVSVDENITIIFSEPDNGESTTSTTTDSTDA